MVHKINAHADRKVERELVADLRRVRGKHGILFKMADAALEHPDHTVREALFLGRSIDYEMPDHVVGRES